MRPSERTWPTSSSVSRIRRAVARVIPVNRATSLSVSAGRSREKTWMTAMPRSSDCSDCRRSRSELMACSLYLHHATMRTNVRKAHTPALAGSDRQPLAHEAAERLDCLAALVEHEMAHAGQRSDLGVGYEVGPCRGLLDGDEAIGVAPQDQGRHPQAVQPAVQLEVVRTRPHEPRGRCALAIAVGQELR